MQKVKAAIAAAAILVVGAIAGSMVGAGAVNAQTSPTPSARADDDVTKPHGPCRHGAPLGALVENGTITQAQADAIHANLKEKRQELRADGVRPRARFRAMKRQILAGVLADLVKDKTITQAQSDAILKWLDEHRPMRAPATGSNTTPTSA